MDISRSTPITQQYSAQFPTATKTVVDNTATNEQQLYTREKNAAQPGDDKSVSNEETEFFARLFPTAADDIRAHQLYDRAGIKSQAYIGSLIDKRG